MDYYFKSIGYEQYGPFSMPIINAEVEIRPDSHKEWRDIHEVINSTSSNEMKRPESIFNFRPTLPTIKNVYFNPPATVVLWDDGTKTVVKCQNGDTYSKETGLALCMAKKAMGNKSAFNDIFKKWIPEEKKEEPKKPEQKVEKKCHTCKYFRLSLCKEPCTSCDFLYSNWRPEK